jgi:hypothetical protein
MHVQMKNRLPGARTHIQHRSVAVFDRPLARNAGGCQMTATDYFGIIGGGFLQSGDMLFRDNKHVRRTLRIQIFESKGVIVFVNLLGWDFASYDAAEKTVRHELVSYRLGLRSSGE